MKDQNLFYSWPGNTVCVDIVLIFKRQRITVVFKDKWWKPLNTLSGECYHYCDHEFTSLCHLPSAQVVNSNSQGCSRKVLLHENSSSTKRRILKHPALVSLSADVRVRQNTFYPWKKIHGQMNRWHFAWPDENESDDSDDGDGWIRLLAPHCSFCALPLK